MVTYLYSRLFFRPFLIIIFLFGLMTSETMALSTGDDVAPLFQKQSNSIVLIAVSAKDGEKLGTGFVISEDGLIATNYHVVNGAQKILVKFRNKKVYKKVDIFNLDEAKDIALIKIRAQGLRPVELGNSSDVAIGERVVTIGNPLGLESTVSDGLVSSWRKIGPGFKILQISVPLSQGSSGGPLFTLKGKVVGITTASVAQGQNLNFAVPINYLKPLLKGKSEPSKGFHEGKENKSALKIASAKISLADDQPLYYRVKPNDTLFSLARKFNTTVDVLQQLNSLKSTNLEVGQRLKLPGRK